MVFNCALFIILANDRYLLLKLFLKHCHQFLRTKQLLILLRSSILQAIFCQKMTPVILLPAHGPMDQAEKTMNLLSDLMGIRLSQVPHTEPKRNVPLLTQ